METRDQIYDQDRGESAIYEKIDSEASANLPITKQGFEALISRVCIEFKLPLDDDTRLAMVKYIHHLPMDQRTVTVSELGKVFHKSMANFTSWVIDQEIKKKRIAEAAKAREDSEKRLPDLTVV